MHFKHKRNHSVLYGKTTSSNAVVKHESFLADLEKEKKLKELRSLTRTEIFQQNINERIRMHDDGFYALIDGALEKAINDPEHLGKKHYLPEINSNSTP